MRFLFDKDILTLHFGVLLVALLCCVSLWNRGVIALVATIGVTFGLEIGVILFVRFAEKRASFLNRQLDQLDALSMAEAKRRVVTLLGGSQVRFHVGIQIPDGLTESQKEFFREFDGAQLGDGSDVTLSDFRNSKWMPDFVVIGGNGANEILTKLGDDRVWEVEGPVSERRLPEYCSPSIWHYYLANSGDDWRFLA